MDLERVKEFLVIAEELSFKKAATRLGIAPNVLSTRYKNFEKSLETTLIERNAHQTVLTETGDLFLKNAEELLTLYHNMLSHLEASKSTLYPNLKIELCGVGMSGELGLFLDRYNRRHPQLQLSLLADNAYAIHDGLNTGNIDIAIAYGDYNAFSDIPGRICLSHTSNLCVYVPNDHPLATKTQISFSELDHEQFILYPESTENCIRNHQMACLDKANINYTLYMEDYDARFYTLLVPIGKGLILSPIAEIVPPNSTALHIKDSGYDVYTYLLYHTETQNKATLSFITEFQDFLKEIAHHDN